MKAMKEKSECLAILNEDILWDGFVNFYLNIFCILTLRDGSRPFWDIIQQVLVIKLMKEKSEYLKILNDDT